MDELGKHFWWKTVGVVIGLGVLGLLCMVIFTGLVARFGAIAALVIIFGILMRDRLPRRHEASSAGTRTTRSRDRALSACRRRRRSEAR